MRKIVIYLNDKEEEQLKRLSSLTARDPVRQAYVILVNGLNKAEKNAEEGNDGRKILALQ